MSYNASCAPSRLAEPRANKESDVFPLPASMAKSNAKKFQLTSWPGANAPGLFMV